MELIGLLNQRNWDDSNDFTELKIKQAMRSKTLMNIKKLYQTYYRGIALNLGFLSVFMLVYIFNPTIEFLIPTLMIISCFLIIVINLVFHLWKEEKVDLSGELKLIITEMLTFDRKVYSRQCKYNSLILMTSFIGGFLMGLAYQGWTISKFLEKPIIFLVLAVFAVGFHFLTKSDSFKNFNKMLNPSYYKTKSYLEHQLELITADDE